ncbi:uncharacterized protein LOC119612378 [Lucilia sericata]|uniref:uncharacterized protein LOC119612378 n=1 Tax=Lucilia sericata TaxID=13632 RepID=UPI0018A87FBA|nr:uncharacterized protein LOC119612378 [Lucilia sericata]
MSTMPRRLRINRNSSNDVPASQRENALVVRSRRLKDCRYCNMDHPLRKCLRFKRLSVRERWNVVRKYRYCINCLAHSHFVKDCRCRDRCRECLSEHHTLLHTSRANCRRHRRNNKLQRNRKRQQQYNRQRSLQMQNRYTLNTNGSALGTSTSGPTIVINVTPK